MCPHESTAATHSQEGSEEGMHAGWSMKPAIGMPHLPKMAREWGDEGRGPRCGEIGGERSAEIGGDRRRSAEIAPLGGEHRDARQSEAGDEAVDCGAGGLQLLGEVDEHRGGGEELRLGHRQHRRLHLPSGCSQGRARGCSKVQGL